MKKQVQKSVVNSKEILVLAVFEYWGIELKNSLIFFSLCL